MGEVELTKVQAAGKEIMVYRYPGTTRQFFEQNRPDAFNRRAADLAWRRTVDLLNAPLAKPKAK